MTGVGERNPDVTIVLDAYTWNSVFIALAGSLRLGESDIVDVEDIGRMAVAQDKICDQLGVSIFKRQTRG